MGEAPALESVRAGLAHMRSAVEIEERLDIDRRGAMPDQEALALAEQATDAYMAAGAALMASGNRFPPDSQTRALLSDNVRFVMSRISALSELLEQRGAKVKRRSGVAAARAQIARNARMSQPTDSNEQLRETVAREILSTEESYVRALDQLIMFYLKPLTCGEDPPLDATDKSAVYANLDEIYGLAQGFLTALRDKVNHWSVVQTLGDVFCTFAMFFKVYVMYTGSFEHGMKVITRILREEPSGQAVAASAAAAGCQDIGSLMITPVQRLPRYVLLLKELRKRTPDAHPDAALLEKALADIRVATDHVNETLRSNADNAKLLEIQSRLWTARPGGVPITLLVPGRRLIREGTLLKIRSTGSLREVRVFLFNDILLYCTSSRLWPGRLHFHNKIEFYGAAPDPQEALRLAPSVSSAKLRLAFKVTSAEAVRVFIPDSLEERDAWLADIKVAVAERQALDRRRSLKRGTQVHLVAAAARMGAP